MSEIKEFIIKKGKYTFVIKENILKYNGIIFSHNFNIGGNKPNCVSVIYKYRNNIPYEAYIPYLEYSNECVLGSNLEKGYGTEMLIKTLLEYTYRKIPSIKDFYFEDMSHIDCVINKNNKKIIKPLKLAYYSIIYNNKTWYEKHFNARMIDNDKYELYRTVLYFLDNKDYKVDFNRFIEITRPSLDKIEKLEYYYNKSLTYREFFNNIPYEERCIYLSEWLNEFMNYYLEEIYSDNGWKIDVTNMNNMVGGSKNKSNLIIKNYKTIHKIR